MISSSIIRLLRLQIVEDWVDSKDRLSRIDSGGIGKGILEHTQREQMRKRERPESLIIDV